MPCRDWEGGPGADCSGTLRQGVVGTSAEGPEFYIFGRPTLDLGSTRGLKKSVFDPEVFLAKADGGRTISAYLKDQLVFRQGDPADAVFTFKKAKSKSPFFPNKAKKRSLPFLARTNPAERDVWQVSRCAWRQPRR